MQEDKTLARRQNTSKLRKHLHQFDNTCAAFRKRMQEDKTLANYKNAAKATTQRK